MFLTPPFPVGDMHSSELLPVDVCEQPTIGCSSQCFDAEDRKGFILTPTGFTSEGAASTHSPRGMDEALQAHPQTFPEECVACMEQQEM